MASRGISSKVMGYGWVLWQGADWAGWYSAFHCFFCTNSCTYGLCFFSESTFAMGRLSIHALQRCLLSAVWKYYVNAVKSTGMSSYSRLRCYFSRTKAVLEGPGD